VGVGRAGRRCRARAFAARERAPAAMGAATLASAVGFVSAPLLARSKRIAGLRGSRAARRVGPAVPRCWSCSGAVAAHDPEASPMGALLVRPDTAIMRGRRPVVVPDGL
jgi:hypothetical protein